jgi:hypothetical protein
MARTRSAASNTKTTDRRYSQAGQRLRDSLRGSGPLPQVSVLANDDDRRQKGEQRRTGTPAPVRGGVGLLHLYPARQQACD